MPERPDNPDLKWAVDATARPGEPGSAKVKIRASSAMVPDLTFDMVVDWRPGAEAADVEGRALVILSLLCQELSEECERVAGERFTEG